MRLTPLPTMADYIEALLIERVKKAGYTNLLWKITKNMRSLECVAGRSGDRRGGLCE